MDSPDLTSRDLTTQAADGYPLALRLISAPEPTHAVLVTSGTGYPMGFYDRFARHLAARGAAVMLHDMRGIGGSRPRIWRRWRCPTRTGGGSTCPQPSTP